MFHFFSRFETIWKSLASLAGRFLGFLQQQQKQHKKSTEKDSREKHHTQNEKRAPTNFCSLILSCTAAGVYCKARCRRARYCHGQKPAAKPYEECKAKALRSNAVRCDQKATGDLRVLIFQVGLPQMMCLPSLKKRTIPADKRCRKGPENIGFVNGSDVMLCAGFRMNDLWNSCFLLRQSVHALSFVLGECFGSGH